MGLIWFTLIGLVSLSVFNDCLCVTFQNIDELNIDFKSEEDLKPSFRHIVKAFETTFTITANDKVYMITKYIIGFSPLALVLLGIITEKNRKYVAAVKIMFADQGYSSSSLLAEFDIYKILGAFDATNIRDSHACVPQAYQFFNNVHVKSGNDSFYLDALFMQLLGPTLDDIIDKHKVSSAEVNSIAPALLICVDFIHSYGVIVNDIKHNNLFVGYGIDRLEWPLFVSDYGISIDLHISPEWKRSTLVFCSDRLLGLIASNAYIEARAIDDFFSLLLTLTDMLEDTVFLWEKENEDQEEDYEGTASTYLESRKLHPLKDQCAKDESGKLTTFLELIKKWSKYDKLLVHVKKFTDIFQFAEQKKDLIKYSDYNWEWIKKKPLSMVPHVLTNNFINEEIPVSFRNLFRRICYDANSEFIIEGKYKMMCKLVGHGSTKSLVLLGTKLENHNEYVAIKVRHRGTTIPNTERKTKLKNQSDFMIKLSNDHAPVKKYIPKTYDYFPEITLKNKQTGVEEKVEVLIMELLGPSVQTLSTKFNFPLKSIQLISDAMMDFLKYLHEEEVYLNQLRAASILIDRNGKGFKVIGFSHAGQKNVDVTIMDYGMLSCAPLRILNSIIGGIQTIKWDEKDDYIWYLNVLLGFLELPGKSFDFMSESKVFKAREIILARMAMPTIFERDMSGTINEYHDVVNYPGKLDIHKLSHMFKKHITDSDYNQLYFWVGSIEYSKDFKPWNAE